MSQHHGWRCDEHHRPCDTAHLDCALSDQPLDWTVSARTFGAAQGANLAGCGSSDGMGVSTAHLSGPDATRAVLEAVVAGDAALRLRRQVLGWHPSATVEQVEDAFQEACARAARSCRGQSEGEVYTWLRTTTHRCLIRMRQRAEREALGPRPIDELEIDDESPGVETIVVERESRVEIEQVAKNVLGRLDERQLRVVALHAHGLRRQEIADRLELSPRVVKRVMEQVLAVGRAELAAMAGRGCDDGHEKVSRYAFGLSGQHDARSAQLHLATCQRCGSMFERLDVWRESVTALAPVPPAAVEAHTHLVERLVHVGGENALTSGTSSAGREGLRQQALAGLAQARDHAAAVYYRAFDPTPLAGVRPGAVAAVVAGCLAVGGSATYCVQHAQDPIAALTGSSRPAASHRAHHAKPRPVAHTAQAPAVQAAPPVVQAAPTTATATTPQSAASGKPTTTHKTKTKLAPAPQDEYEPTSPAGNSRSSPTASAASVTSHTTPAPTTHRKPAAAPAGGVGEFNGP
jgi:RNA polymerase sigma factor (sigma-70 family)